MPEKYVEIFGNLRTDRGRDRYPEITYPRAERDVLVLLTFSSCKRDRTLIICQGTGIESYEVIGIRGKTKSAPSAGG
jgi:hypothetical protein